jgi:diguanylate cyclase (GGDEF)-like protein/PAS domain S-box-containing protein
MKNNGVRPARNGHAQIPQSLDHEHQVIQSLRDYAIFALTLDGNIASWNAGAERTFGYAPAEALGRPYSLLFTAEDIAKGQPESELQTALTLGKDSLEGWLLRKDGSRFWCTDTIQLLHDENGGVSGFSKLVRDSTARHDVEEHLRDSEERLRLLIEGVTDYAIFSLDTSGRILFWNSGAEHLYGYPEAEVVGKHFSLIYTPEAVARGIPTAEIAIAAKNGHAQDEGWHQRRNGAMFYASGQMTRLRPDADGSPRGFVKIAQDITARNRAEQTIRRQAFHDELTQLPNRAFFSDCLRRSIARAKRHTESRFAVIFIDLDRFKNINDSLGHVLADDLLVHVARLLERCVRPEDVVARLGGDEFTILLPEIREVAEAMRIAARVHAALQHPIFLEAFEIYTTASIGIAIGSSLYDKPEEILRDADTAMYEAKARGRSRHVLFDSEMHARAVRLLDLQMDLRRAISRQELFINYQPIVSLRHGRTLGFEALVRWYHPSRGVLPPAEFIAEAENIGLIIQIDRWVLREACRQLREWQVLSGDPALTVSVNLSSKQFASEDLVEEIQDVLRRNDLAPGNLKLEITETVFMEHFDTTAATLAKLGKLGVQLYIDDFGTGYSSLSYLTRFPLKLLKVDRSFVSKISSDPRSAEIARTIVTLAHNLGLKALAEGIETDEGYFFSPPVDPGEATGFIGRSWQFDTETWLRPAVRASRERRMSGGTSLLLGHSAGTAAT